MPRTTLSALSVVLGTLVLQGLTLAPLIRLLRIEPDGSLKREMAQTRVMLLDAAIDSLRRREEPFARRLSEVLTGERRLAEEGRDAREVGELHHWRRRTLTVRRRELFRLRESGAIEEDVFHAMLQELDWAELGISPPRRLEIVEG